MATIGELVTVARDLLQDTRPGVPFRHADEKLVRYMNTALADAKRLRPDLFLPNIASKEYNFTTADFAVPFPLEYAYSPPFVDYMAGMVSIEEDEYVAEGRAAALLARFGAKLLQRVM